MRPAAVALVALLAACSSPEEAAPGTTTTTATTDAPVACSWSGTSADVRWELRAGRRGDGEVWYSLDWHQPEGSSSSSGGFAVPGVLAGEQLAPGGTISEDPRHDGFAVGAAPPRAATVRVTLDDGSVREACTRPTDDGSPIDLYVVPHPYGTRPVRVELLDEEGEVVAAGDPTDVRLVG